MNRGRKTMSRGKKRIINFTVRKYRFLLRKLYSEGVYGFTRRVVLPRDLWRLKHIVYRNIVFHGLIWVKYEAGWLNEDVIRLLRQVKGCYILYVAGTIWNKRMTKTALSGIERKKMEIWKTDGIPALVVFSKRGRPKFWIKERWEELVELREEFHWSFERIAAYFYDMYGYKVTAKRLMVKYYKWRDKILAIQACMVCPFLGKPPDFAV